ncbi:MAG: methyltransferase, partial [Candidatus Nanohaloarchaea archaeon]|nr:methyltransferase [Candidatus Nanohaloarchaea archaeon]
VLSMTFHTDGRDYDVYVELMSNEGVLEVKYNDIKEFLQPGKIVDDGCGDGALLMRVSEDFSDSKLVGVDLSKEMILRAYKREERGDYGDADIDFTISDVQSDFEDVGKADSVIASSICHEIWSYENGEEDLQNYFNSKYRQLKENGRLIIRDVIGPFEKNKTVWAWFNDENGFNTGALTLSENSELQEMHLDSLSTLARFKRFLRDFYMRDLTDRLSEFEERLYREDDASQTPLFKVNKDIAVEYMLTKDYTDNWMNEMREEFTFWTPQHYEEALEEAGFEVIHRDVYTNEWIEENRFEGKAELYEEIGMVL